DRRRLRRLAAVRRRLPRRLGRELDQLRVAVALDVAEALRLLVEVHVQLALLHALVEPRSPEDEAPEPMDERAVRGADEVVPAVVDVAPERRYRFADLAVDRQVHEVLELVQREARL